MGAEGNPIVFAAVMDVKSFDAGASHVKRSAGNMQKSVEAEGVKMQQSFNRIGSAITAAFAVTSIVAFTKKLIEVRGEFQAIEVSLKTILNDEAKGVELMEQLVHTAATTPFQLQEVSKGATSLLAYGESAETVNETLLRLGDIAAGLSIPLNDLIYLYGTTMVQGRVFAMDMRQFMGRGIPVAEELAKQFGVAKDAVGDLVRDGKVGFEHIKIAIESMTNEGGKFAGLMGAISGTLKGSVSNLLDRIDMAINDMGKRTEGLLKGTINAVSFAVENYEYLAKAILGVVAAVGTYKAALITLAAAKRLVRFAESVKLAFELTKGLKAATRAQEMFNLASAKNPYILLASVIVGVAVALTAFNKKQKETLKNAGEAAAAIDEERKALDRLFKIAKSEKATKEQRKNAIEAINAKYGDYLDNLVKETDSVKKLDTAYKNLTASLNAKYLTELKQTMTGGKETAHLDAQAALQGAMAKIAEDMTAEQAGRFTRTMRDYVTKFSKRLNAADLYEEFARQYKLYTSKDLGGRKAGTLYSAIWDFKKSQYELYVANKEFNEFAKGYNTELTGLTQLTTESAASMRQELEDARKAWLAAKKIYDEMDRGTTPTATLKGAKENMDASYTTYADLYEIYYGQKLDAVVKAQAKSEEDIAKATEQYNERLFALMADAEKVIIESTAVQMTEGLTSYNASLIQAKAEYDTAIADLKQKRIELQALADEAGLKPDFTPIEMMEGEALAKWMHNTEVAQKELLKEYATYLDKRKELTERYNTEIAELEKLAATEQAEVARKRFDEALKELDFAALKENALFEKIFKNLDYLSAETIEELTKRLEEFIAFIESGLSGDDAGEGLKKFGITAEQLVSLRDSTDQLSELKRILEGLRKEGDKFGTAFGKIGAAWKKMIDEFAAGNMTEANAALESLHSQINAIAGAIEDLGQSLQNIGSSTDNAGLEKAGKVISGIADAVSAAGSGAATGAALGGPIGAIAGGALGAGLNIIKQITGAQAEMQKAHDAYEIKARTLATDLNALYRERYQWAQKIGESTMAWMRREGAELERQLASATKDAQTLMRQLREESYTVWYEKKGIFGGTRLKNRDEIIGMKSYAQIEQLYLQGLLSENATILFEKLKAAREEAEGLSDTALDYQERMRQALTGSTYDGVVAGMVAGIKDGGKTAASTFEDLMRDAVNSSLELFANSEMRKWYEEFATLAGDEEGLTAAEIQLLRNSYLALYNSIDEKNRQLMEITGLGSIAKPRESVARTGLAASQESVDITNAIMTNIANHTYAMNENVRMMRDINSQLLIKVTNIEGDTGAMRGDLKALRNDISVIMTKGLMIAR